MFENIKYKFNFYINKLLYTLTKDFKYHYQTKCYYHIRFRKNNKIIIVENGVENTFPITKYINGVDIVWHGDNNTLIIDNSCNLAGSKFFFEGNNNTFLIREQGIGKYKIISAGDNNIVIIDSSSKMDGSIINVGGNNNKVLIGKRCRGMYKLTQSGDNNTIRFGERVEAQSMTVFLHDGDNFTIGNNCMLADGIFCCTDGHSVYDIESYELLNKPPYNVEIGNHVWLGRNVSLLKSVTIPDNCVVGMNSTVTKRFSQQNCVIAGNPAKIVKEHINWNGRTPAKFDISDIDKSF